MPNNRPITRVVKPNTAPAVGGEFSFTPNLGGGWLFHSLTFLLVTSAVAATRVPTLTASNGSDRYLQLVGANGQIANTTNRYTAYPGASNGSQGGGIISFDFPSQGLWIPQGNTLASVTANIDAGDQYSLVVAQVTEYPTDEDWPITPLLPYRVLEVHE